MRLFLLLTIGLAGAIPVNAQTTVLSVGSTSSLTIKNGTVFSADSLVLTPSSDLTLASNTIQVSPTAVAVSPVPGINRAYYLGSQVNFTGTIQLYYQLSELNSNPESALKYTDSAVGGSWLASASSTVNTTNHYVQQAAVARNFIGATASHQGTVLALSLISFSGAWQGDEAGLAWIIDQAGEIADFTIDRSSDGANWTDIGTVAGLPGDGVKPYTWNDPDPPAGNLLYRLRIHRSNGATFYSTIVKLERTANGNIRLVAHDHSVIAYFDGVQPTAVRIVDPAGSIIRVDQTSRLQYRFNGLFTGVYYLQYEINGTTATKSFLIP